MAVAVATREEEGGGGGSGSKAGEPGGFVIVHVLWHRSDRHRCCAQ